MAELNVTGFGEEASHLVYNDFMDWFVSYVDPTETWKVHKSFVLCQLVVVIGACLIFLHALKQGGRWPFYVVATIMHGLTVEFVSYFFPHIDNFWHAQGVITFIERRLPLYVMLLYTLFYYQASWAVSKMKLKSSMVEYLAIGLVTVLIDMPFDIVGIKYLHWVWHDTDPNIADRHYWVPWNSYYFHLTFAASFHFFFHQTRKWLDRRELQQWERGTIVSELVAIVVAGLMGMPGGCLLFVPLYHPLHDFYGIPTEVTTVIILIVTATIVWKFDRKSNRYNKPVKLDFLSKALIVHLICFFALQLGTVVFLNPKDVVSIGVHEKIGNCNEMLPVETILKTLTKRKYLCATDNNSQYFDFHCLPGEKVPNEGSYWYTICGTDFENRVEMIAVIALLCFVSAVVFWSLHFDYDKNLMENLTSADRRALKKAPKTSAKKKVKSQ